MKRSREQVGNIRLGYEGGDMNDEYERVTRGKGGVTAVYIRS